MADQKITELDAIASSISANDVFVIVVDTAETPTNKKATFTSLIASLASSFAAASHNHAASDINSGTLATARGGRGRGNYTAAGRIPYASSTTLEGDTAGLQFFGSGISIGASSDSSYIGAAYLAATGLYVKAAGSSNDAARLTRTECALSRDAILTWGGIVAVVSSPDIGLARYASGVLRVTDASTGKGDLLIGPSSATKHAAAALQIDSTTQGFQLPRMTGAQRDAISVTSNDYGLMIFNTDTDCPDVYTSFGWGQVQLNY
jgi:hypothetical protein